jgi:hypothetical protein
MIIDNFLKDLSVLAEESCIIDESLFKQFDVKRGLRNADHTGVLVGLTRVGSVVGYEKIDGVLQAIESISMTWCMDARQQNDRVLMRPYFFCCSEGFQSVKNLMIFRAGWRSYGHCLRISTGI